MTVSNILASSLFRYILPALLFVSNSSLKAQLVINEFMSDNESYLVDNEGDFTDWLELYNNSTQVINLEGYFLSDDAEDLQKWSFPSTSINARGFLKLYVSGKGEQKGTPIHTNFKIAASGENIYLSDSLGELLDITHAVSLGPNESYGRLPDGGNSQGILYNPSPGASNDQNNFINCLLTGGFYKAPIAISLSSLVGDTIRYTLDGSLPGLNSPAFKSLSFSYHNTDTTYLSFIPTSVQIPGSACSKWETPQGPFEKAHILRYCSYRADQQTSKVYTHTYWIDSGVQQRFNLPVLSIVTDAENLFNPDSGIYVPGNFGSTIHPQHDFNYSQSGWDWERPVHLEYYSQDGTLLFKQNAGIRIHGGGSRNFPQKSMKIYARKRYGNNSFDYPLLPKRQQHSYKRFLLRSSYSDCQSKTLIKDMLGHEIVRGLNLEYQDYQPVVLFINGEYWGLHEIRDKVDEYYLAFHNELDSDSIDFICGNLKVYSGSADSYIQLRQFIKFNDLSIDSNYNYVSTLMDIPGYIDYQIAEQFLRNCDWPYNNVKMWRPQKHDGKWRWVFFDMDVGFMNPDYNMFEHAAANDSTIVTPNPPGSTLIFRKLIENEEFKTSFIERYAELLNTEFGTDGLLGKLDSVQQLVKSEVFNNNQRWNTQLSVPDWEEAIDWALRDFLENRPCVIEEQIKDFFDLNAFGFTCLTSENANKSRINELIISPNPNNGSFYITNQTGSAWSGHLIIHDPSAIQIVNRSIEVLKDESFQINLSGVTPGIYLLNLIGQEIHQQSKMVLLPK